ncbi:hypothetical protein D9611_001426 [Ephemerocybe angulata]|uniref:Galactose oxidase n=1 Tax=Ephemerocybe angulata TaxID=980116 RepID=A0A8H5FMH6_9AGAR|nr:hypothetical protein D9611_001426 [Tulosesus angulatus]
MHWPWSLFIFVNALIFDACAQDHTGPRWGQAFALVNDILYVYGGKTDEFNQFSYTSAPNTNDILYLDLSTTFTASFTPWSIVNGEHNATSLQGPALAWHTASTYNTSQILVFGGLPDANSDTHGLGQPDSAGIIDVWARMNPMWVTQSIQLINQPIRRIRHSTATIPTGLVFIFGGEKADGSGTAFSDNYVYDPNTSSFTQLPTENGPPDLVGHVSITLYDGRILVFGGYVPSQNILLLLSTIYVLDTTTTPYTWSLLKVSAGSLPNTRRAFAATLISPTRIMIHGGSDAHLQTTYDDGWVLDLSQPEAEWIRVDSLTGLGPRRDHFAVTSGDNVVFGFGYGQSAPVSSPVQVYNVPSSTIVPTFTPRPSTSTPPATLPPATSTPTHSPTTTKSGHSTSSTGTTPPIATNTNKPDTPAEAEAKKNRVTKIAVSTSLGVLAFAAIILGAAYYRHKKQRRWEQNRFWVIDNTDDGHERQRLPADDVDSQIGRNIPLAGSKEASPDIGPSSGWLSTLGIAGIAGLLTGSSNVKSQNPGQVQERRNMLDDEDAADFGTWYNSKKRDGTTTGSTWSLVSILGRTRNRDSASSTPWREKSDPFGDGASSLALHDDEENIVEGTSAFAARPRARRDASYVSNRSGFSYTDPFKDPIQEEPREASESTTAYDHSALPPGAMRVVPPSLPPVTTLLPLEGFTAHALSPLSERTSVTTLPHDSGSSMGGRSSDSVLFSSVNSRAASSHTSSDRAPRSPTLLSGLLPATEGGVKRSDSWWSRLARRASDAGVHRQGSRVAREMRDPNPPPTRLSAIVERTTPEKTPSPADSKAGSRGSRKSSAGVAGVGSGAVYQKAKHGKSLSSVRTADTAAIERMAGAMEVVRRDDSGSMSSHGSRSLYAASHEGDDEGGSLLSPGNEEVSSPLEMEYSQYRPILEGSSQEELGGIVSTSSGKLEAPVPVRPLAVHRQSASGPGLQLPQTSSPSTPSSSASTSRSGSRTSARPMGPRRSTTFLGAQPGPGSAASMLATAAAGNGLKSAPPTEASFKTPQVRPGSVAARIQALEGRRDTTSGASSGGGERGSKRLTVDYGLVPRRSLFIANPDDGKASVDSHETK